MERLRNFLFVYFWIFTLSYVLMDNFRPCLDNDVLLSTLYTTVFVPYTWNLTQYIYIVCFIITKTKTPIDLH